MLFFSSFRMGSLRTPPETSSQERFAVAGRCSPPQGFRDDSGLKKRAEEFVLFTQCSNDCHSTQIVPEIRYGPFQHPPVPESGMLAPLCQASFQTQLDAHRLVEGLSFLSSLPLRNLNLNGLIGHQPLQPCILLVKPSEPPRFRLHPCPRFAFHP